MPTHGVDLGRECCWLDDRRTAPRRHRQQVGVVRDHDERPDFGGQVKDQVEAGADYELEMWQEVTIESPGLPQCGVRGLRCLEPLAPVRVFIKSRESALPAVVLHVILPNGRLARGIP